MRGKSVADILNKRNIIIGVKGDIKNTTKDDY